MSDVIEPQLSFDDPDPALRTWSDAFPWLSGVTVGSGVAWWNETFYGPAATRRAERIAQVSELAMNRLTRWSIGEIFPGLSTDIDLRELRIPARAINALVRSKCETTGDLMTIELGDVMGWRQIGAGTVHSILCALAELSVMTPTPTVISQFADDSHSQVFGGEKESLLKTWASNLLSDFHIIANWYKVIGLPTQAILGEPLPPRTPAAVAEARSRIEALQQSEILGNARESRDIAGHFDRALSWLDVRAIDILKQRLFADNPTTLEELGRVHNVTRERIRQIEGKARGALVSHVLSNEGPIAGVSAYVRTLIGTISPLDDLLESIPALNRTVTSLSLPAWRVLDRLDDAYEIEDGWCVAPTMSAALSATQTFLEERCDQFGVVRVDDFELLQTIQTDRQAQITKAWLSHCGYVVKGDFVLTRTSSVGDYAAGLLSIEGSPLSSQDIVDRFVFERSVRSLGNALASDERFERVDRDKWALTDWGLDAYTGIRSIIRELVARSGGRAELSQIVEHITGRYSVSSSSVIAYAGASPFVTEDGIVKLATEGRTARKSPQRTKRLFRRSDGWAYRTRITSDHFRGSGSVAPLAIAAILDLPAGKTLQLPSPLGPQFISWTGIQPSFGTIRRFLIENDVAVGTEAFLIIKDDGTFAFEETRELVGDPLTDALSLIGAPPASEHDAIRLALLHAIDAPQASPMASIIGSYRSRGDDEIADLLMNALEYLDVDPSSEHHPGPGVNEIMELL